MGSDSLSFLVTGGAGFIGSHTVALLCAQGHRVRVLDDLSTGHEENLAGMPVELIRGSITEPAQVREAMAGCTHVIHLAALPGVPPSCEDPVLADEINVHGAVIVFEAARRLGVRRVVYASSSAVYGSTPALPKREEHRSHPESPYAAAKAANEAYALAFAHSLGLESVGLRYFNVFGPRQDPDGPYAAVLPRFVERCLRGEPLPVFGDGEQTRDFVPVADVARANLRACVAPGVAGRVFNIGTGRPTSVEALAEAIGALLGDPGRVYLPERAGDVRHSLADVSLAREGLGWTPEADFAEALEETVRWYARTLSADRSQLSRGRP